MKKLKIFVGILLTVCMCFALALFVGCGSFELSTPTNVRANSDHKLTWDEVADARSYVIEIKDANGEIIDTRKERRENTSLKNLEVGKYVIRVKAVGSEDGVESDWSINYEFDRPYETGCIYTLVNNSEYHITGAGSASGDIVIEDFYRNKPVTAIADNAFKGNGRITSIQLGNQIKSIGKNAFYRCESLISITIPDSVTSIGPQAFQRCISLTSITIPNGVTMIDEFTFAYCRALKTVNFSDNIQYIGESAFSDCTSMVSYELPDSLVVIGPYAFAANSKLESVKIKKNVQQISDFAFQLCTSLTDVQFDDGSMLTSIGKRAFYDNSSLVSITLPSNLSKIDAQAFMSCDLLANVTIPDSVVSVGSDVFYMTAIQTKQIEEGAEVYYVGKWIVGVDVQNLSTTVEVIATEENEAYSKTLIVRPDTVGVAAYMFYGFTQLKLIQMPTTTKYLGTYSFSVCEQLLRVEVEGCQLIEDYAFVFCKSLQTFMKCQNLEKIGGYAFYGCSGLKKFETPDDDSVLKSIGMFAFKNTGIWTNTSNETNVVYVGNWIVGAKTGISELKIDNDTVGISDFAFFENAKLTTANLASTNLKYIGQGAFYNCLGLKTIRFGVNLNIIEDYTFYGCANLLLIDGGFPRGLQKIGRSAFYGCSSLMSVDFGRAVDFESIGQYAFYGCTALGTVNLGDTVQLVDNYAFYKCESLKEIAIPDSVVMIGNRAFYKNVALEKVTFGEGLLSIGEYAFSGCESIGELKLPNSLLYVQRSAFYKCTAVTNVELGNQLQYIGSYAFYGLSEVTDLQLPASLKQIGSYAFKGWNGLTSILLSGDVTFIGDHAFYGCKQATIYTDVSESLKEELSWSEKFNSSHRPIVWGCTLSQDKTYVESVTITEETFSNTTAKNGFTAPEREGYVFAGWATTSGGDVVYTVDKINEAPVGTTLYSVWTVAQTPDQPEI